MRSRKYLLITSLLVISFIITACSSAVYSSTGWHGMTASPDTIYLAAGGQVYAVDPNTGSQKWRFPDKPNAKGFYASPVLTSDGQLLVPSYDNKLYSLDAATGAEKWTFTGSVNRLIASPLVTETMIYQPSTDYHLYALDLTGKLIWTQETGGQLWAQPASNSNCNCIFVTSMDHIIYSYDEATGKKLWQSADLGGAIVGTPAVDQNGIMYIGTFGNEIIAMNDKTGDIVWRFTTQDWVWAGPTLANNVLYFGDRSGYFYAVDTSGKSLWRIQPDKTIVDASLVVGDNIYFTTAETFFIVSTAGNIVQSKVLGGELNSTPISSGDNILVAPINKSGPLLIAMSNNGDQKWTFTPGK